MGTYGTVMETTYISLVKLLVYPDEWLADRELWIGRYMPPTATAYYRRLQQDIRATFFDGVSGVDPAGQLRWFHNQKTVVG
jgi:hypothetical protein